MNFTAAKSMLLGTLLLTSATAQADVTVGVKTEGKASVMNVSGDGASKIKGHFMRTDQTMGKNAQSLIIDIDGRRFIDLDDKKKTATITSLDSISDELAKVGIGTMQATLKKTSQTKTIAGYACTVHDINITMPFSPTGQPGQGMDLDMIMNGTVCLSTTAPGLADYQNFYKAAAASGFIFGDPRAAKSPTGAAQAKAYAELTRKMAEAGMALESVVHITASGNNPMAGMMAKLAKSDITTTVTQVTVGDLAAGDFEIPAGYKVKNQK